MLGAKVGRNPCSNFFSSIFTFIQCKFIIRNLFLLTYFKLNIVSFTRALPLVPHWTQWRTHNAPRLPTTFYFQIYAKQNFPPSWLMPCWLDKNISWQGQFCYSKSFRLNRSKKIFASLLTISSIVNTHNWKIQLFPFLLIGFFVLLFLNSWFS